MDQQYFEEIDTQTLEKETNEYTVLVISANGNNEWRKIDSYKFPLESKNNKFQRDQSLPLKPPLSTNDLIARLREHEVEIDDSKIDSVVRNLRQINYYRLSAFITFLPPNNKNFDNLMALYNFDRFLRNKISILLNPLELYIRTTLAHYLACNSPDSSQFPPSLIYMDQNIYINDKHQDYNFKNLISNFYKTLSDRVDHEESLEHYVRKYGGWIPIWVLVEHLTFGNMSRLIKYLNTTLKKGWMSYALPDRENKYITSFKNIDEWIKTLLVLRNTCAHMGRLYGRKNPGFSPNISQIPILTKLDLPGSNENFKHTLFAGLLVLREFYRVLGDERIAEWNAFVKELNEQFNNPVIDPEKMGLNKFNDEDWLISEQ